MLEQTGRWRAQSQRLAGTDLDELAEKWRRVAVITENAFIGGKTGDLGVFDERRGR